MKRPRYTIDFDFPCSDCAYNLRGLPLEARCPECGASIGRSVRRCSQRELVHREIARRFENYAQPLVVLALACVTWAAAMGVRSAQGIPSSGHEQFPIVAIQAIGLGLGLMVGAKCGFATFHSYLWVTVVGIAAFMCGAASEAILPFVPAPMRALVISTIVSSIVALRFLRAAGPDSYLLLLFGLGGRGVVLMMLVCAGAPPFPR